MSAVSKYYTELTIAPRTRKTSTVKGKLKINWTMFAFAFILISLVLIIIIYLCNCAQLVDLQYHISYLNHEKEKISRDIDILNLKVLNLQSYETIQWQACKRLGMVRPAMSLILNISTQNTAKTAGDYFALAKPKTALSR